MIFPPYFSICFYMRDLEILVHTLTKNSLSEWFWVDDMIKLKRAWAKEYKQTHVPTNMEVLKTYKKLVSEWAIKDSKRVEKLLMKRSIRSQSWIVAVQVLTKPFWCPGKCIFCPNDATMPKSYINTQPGAMRALLNQFDPYKQVYNRLLSLMLTGHSTDKIEMIVLGWTWDVYPQNYKIEFIKWLYDACNHFDEFLSNIQIDYSNPKAPRYTSDEWLDITYPDSISESIVRNESAKRRIIWLTIETRPEYVTHENCKFWRELWVTRMEMWIQTLHNSVHEMNKRGHTNKEIETAMHRLRQYWFKISNHYMPWLYGSTIEKDIETFSIAYSHPGIKSDEMKFYPTAVIPNTPLYDLWKDWTYKPITAEELELIIRKAKLEIIPPYARIKRLARDFDTNEVVAWANTPNLRQLVMKDMQTAIDASEPLRKKQYARLYPWDTVVDSLDQLIDEIVASKSNRSTENRTNISSEWREYPVDDTIKTYIVWWSVDLLAKRKYVCLCTRCREMRHSEKKWNDSAHHLFPVIRHYKSSNWHELFCSFEDTYWYLHWFTRLLLPDEWTTIDWPWLWESTAMIRELHVYGTLQKIDVKKWSDKTAQHWGLWSQLLEIASMISEACKYTRLSVISWVWVKAYYAKKWFDHEWTYMVKTFRS